MEKARTAQLRHRFASTRRISVSAPARLPAREGFRSSLGEGGFFNLRASITLLICTAAACSVLAGALLAFFRPETSSTASQRSEEHTSELQSRGHLVCRLLLEK